MYDLIKYEILESCVTIVDKYAAKPTSKTLDVLMYDTHIRDIFADNCGNVSVFHECYDDKLAVDGNFAGLSDNLLR